MRDFLEKSYTILKDMDTYFKNKKTHKKTIFYDNEDLFLYKEVDNILKYTKVIITQYISKKDIEYSKKDIVILFICSYVLAIKFFTDSVVHKQYSFFCKAFNMSKKDIKMFIETEKMILNSLNFLSETFPISNKFEILYKK